MQNSLKGHVIELFENIFKNALRYTHVDYLKPTDF